MSDTKTEDTTLSTKLMEDEQLEAMLLQAVDHGNEEVEQRLNTVLIQIAVSAKCLYAWPLIKKLLKFRFHQKLVLIQKEKGFVDKIENEDVAVWISRITVALDVFAFPPWTLQRICELLLAPESRFRSSAVFVLSVAKLVCGIRERGTKEGDFGLSSEEAPIGDQTKPAFQFPFFNAPRLDSGLKASQLAAPVISATPLPGSAIAESVASGTATVFPKS